MKKYIQFDPLGYISTTFDWFELVQKPYDENNFKEAFSAADSLIDTLDKVSIKTAVQ